MFRKLENVNKVDSLTSKRCRWRQKTVPRWETAVLGVLLSLGLAACTGPEPTNVLQGQTMGTYFRVVTRNAECTVTKSAVQLRLDDLNASLSTYQSDSELSLLNNHPAGIAIPVGADLAAVLRSADQVARQSGGAFDVTVGPLVNLWGFGPASVNSQTAPTPAAQAAAAARVGMHLIQFQTDQITKLSDDVYIDLSALAKGYAVDQIAQLLAANGCVNFMADIGGEIFVAGLNPQQQPWRLGIETPSPDQLGDIHTVVSLTDLAIATSGDYRNFRLVDGKRVDHMLDPRTGRPATNFVVSATVVHESAMLADAYATAFMVMGQSQAMALAQQLDLAVYLIMARAEQAGDDAAQRWQIRYNAAMRQYLPAQATLQESQ